MKKLIKILPFILLVSSIIIPILPVIAEPTEEEDVVYTTGAAALPGDWDPVITDGYNIIYGSYTWECMEPLVGTPAGYRGGTTMPIEEEYVAVLATNWTMEYYPIEQNEEGWNSTGGIMSSTFTLREGVEFHDGSDWNATVAKWNLDRWWIVTGNLSAIEDDPDDPADYQNHGNGLYWIQANTQKTYWTTWYNRSDYDAIDITTTPPKVAPTADDYSKYYVGTDVSYPGVNIDAEGYVKHPDPYGGWDYSTNSPMHYAPYDTFPLIQRVEIIDDKKSGGTIKIHFNNWGTSGIFNIPMMSYNAYRHNYTSQGVYGFENDVKHADNPTLVDHMIGTGPYRYIDHDELGEPPGGYMLKNENYWNGTALEADGWFDVDRHQIIKFPAGELSKSVRDTALLTHEIDYTWDSMYMPVDLDGVMSNPNIAYFPSYPSEFKTQIVLNSINDTWYAWPAGVNAIKSLYDNEEIGPRGIPRKMREAINYAFDYDTMINTVLDGRAVRGGTTLGSDSLYYNESTYIPQYNLTRAREILLTTETDSFNFNLSTPIPHEPVKYHKDNGYFPDPDLYNFSKMCAERDLTASSTDADWQDVADNDPILVVDFWWDSAHENVKNVLLTSLQNIGVTLKDKTGATNRVPTIIWDYVRNGDVTSFPGTDPKQSLWSVNAWIMDEDMPPASPEMNTFWAYVDPDRGRWRTEGTAGIQSGYHYWGNFGFTFDDDVVKWMDRIFMSSASDRKKWHSKIAEREATLNFPKIWCYQAKEGFCLWKDWETYLTPDRMGNPTGFWGGISTHFLRYTPENLVSEYPLISAYPLLITLTGSVVSMLGIIYAIIRKRKLH